MIYYFEDHPVFGPPTRSFVNRMRVARQEILSSHLIIAEALVVPKRNVDLFTAMRYRHFFMSSSLSLIPLSADAAECFADIRASTRVKPADALHLAFAASVRTGYFVTTDTRLHTLSIPGIAQICPPEAVLAS